MRRSDLPDIPGYELKHELGSGGMATVFLAVQKSLDRKVAIKILKTDDDDDAEKTERRFLREGRTLAKITHRNVCGIYDIAKIGDIAYIAMEYLDGGTLVDKLKAGLSVGEAIAVTVQVASALSEAHAQGIIHRDLKPANVMMRGGRVPVLTDFGIARELAANQTKITAENMIVGTPAYMSPEQVSGGEVDGSSDVYSLGIMLFELLTGQVPYRGESPIAVCMQHLTAPLPKLPVALAELQPILDRMLAKKREDRFNSMQEFTIALRNAFVASTTLRSVLKFAPDQPWSEQLRNLGFTFDTIRDSDIKAALEAQKAAARQARANAEGLQQAPPAESIRAPLLTQASTRPGWLLPVLLAMLLLGGGGIAWWLSTRGPSATEELALKSLKRDFEQHIIDRKLYGDDADNAAALLEQMRDISSRSDTTKLAENTLWSETEKAARKAVDGGEPSAVIQDLVNRASNSFDSARVQALANELNAKLEAGAKQRRIDKALADLEAALKDSAGEYGAALEDVRKLVPEGDPRRAQLEGQVEAQLAKRVGLAQTNDDLGTAERAVSDWRMLFPQSAKAEESRRSIEALLAKRGLKAGIDDALKQLQTPPFGVSTVNVVGSALKRLRADPQAATEKAALDRLEASLLERLQREFAAQLKGNPAQAEQLLQVALRELPASPTLNQLNSQLGAAQAAAAAAAAEAEAAAQRGTLAIDATPWAKIRALRDAGGKNVALPANASTPLVLTLTEGSYQVDLEDSSGKQTTRAVLVTRQQRAQVRADLQSLDAERYLQEAGFQ